MIKLSIVIPAYNEEKTIVTVLTAVSEQRIPGVELEVIVVNDGSKDGTAALIQKHPALYSKFVDLPKNGGKGAAVIAGLAAASGEYILFQDADLEYDPDDYAKVLLPVTKFNADIVMGSRMRGAEYTRVHYFWNRVGNWTITMLLNILYNKTFTDIYTCYFLYRRSLVDVSELRTSGFEQQAEILCKALRQAQRVYEVPISYNGRTFEEGKKIRAHHIFSVIWQIFFQRLTSLPQRR